MTKNDNRIIVNEGKVTIMLNSRRPPDKRAETALRGLCHTIEAVDIEDGWEKLAMVMLVATKILRSGVGARPFGGYNLRALTDVEKVAFNLKMKIRCIVHTDCGRDMCCFLCPESYSIPPGHGGYYGKNHGVTCDEQSPTDHYCSGHVCHRIREIAKIINN